jgi:hypothetical protein
MRSTVVWERMAEPVQANYAHKKVALIQVLAEGNSHAAATSQDLDFWISSYGTSFPSLLDPGLAQLGGFPRKCDCSALPFEIILDARSMEILRFVQGAPSSDGVTISLQDADDALAWVRANPPTPH